MAEVINLDTLELPDCEHCDHPSKRVYAHTMDSEMPAEMGCNRELHFADVERGNT